MCLHLPPKPVPIPAGSYFLHPPGLPNFPLLPAAIPNAFKIATVAADTLDLHLLKPSPSHYPSLCLLCTVFTKLFGPLHRHSISKVRERPRGIASAGNPATTSYKASVHFRFGRDPRPGEMAADVRAFASRDLIYFRHDKRLEWKARKGGVWSIHVCQYESERHAKEPPDREGLLDPMYWASFGEWLDALLRDPAGEAGGMLRGIWPERTHVMDLFTESVECMIIHEMLHTHHGRNCKDYGYGWSECVDLASAEGSMKRARRNAESIAIFACVTGVLVGVPGARCGRLGHAGMGRMWDAVLEVMGGGDETGEWA